MSEAKLTITPSFRTILITSTGERDPKSKINRIGIGGLDAVMFLPRNIFKQLQRVSNMWFIALAVFQVFTPDSSLQSGWGYIAPLILLFVFAIIKDALVEIKRYRQDREANQRKFSVWNGLEFQPKKCQEIRVGNLVLLQNDECAPADMLLLALGGSCRGSCHVDVSGIIGERNLKQKFPIKSSVSVTISDIDRISSVISRLEGEARIQDPTISISSFEGKIKMKGFPAAEHLSLGNLILRGSVLRSASWVLTAVLYTGKETKIMLNTQKIPVKMTRVERLVSRIMMALILVCVTMSMLSALLNQFAAESPSSDNFFIVFATFLQVYRHIASIWVFVAMDILRVFYLWKLIKKKKEAAELCNTSVCEDLGRVEYIVMDKSGTLTESCSAVRDLLLGEDSFSPCDEHHFQLQHADSPSASKEVQDTECDCGYAQLKARLRESQDADLFLTAMALCNSATQSPESSMVFSRDDKALLSACCHFAYRIIIKSSAVCVLATPNSDHPRTYEILASFESSSRHHTMLRLAGSSSAMLFVKGSAQSMLGGTRPLLLTNPSTQFVLQKKIEEFTRSGQKAIVFAYKIIEETLMEDLMKKIETATRAVYNKTDKIEKLFEAYERSLTYLALVGVEESVLPSTSSTINTLKSAGIKLWLVSGDDSASTHICAINAKLMDPDVQCVGISLRKNVPPVSYLRKKLGKLVRRLVLNERVGGREDVLNELEYLNFWRDAQVRRQSELYRSTMSMTSEEVIRTIPYSLNDMRKFALLVYGEAFDVALKDQECKRLLSCLMFLSTAVLFCNMLPLQKAQVVKLIKENFKFRPVTMAIGDGNDDIAMIQEADIGVGMKKEGESRATNNADVAIEHFSQLQTLLLVDGRWYLQRYSKVAILFLYKHILLVMILFGFTFICDYTTLSLFSSDQILLFILVYTMLPALSLGFWDKDLQVETLLDMPQLYRMRMTIFGWRWLSLFAIISLLQCGVIFAAVVPSLSAVVIGDGYTEYASLVEIEIYIELVLIVLHQTVLEASKWSKMFFFLLLFSLVLLGSYFVGVNFSLESDYANVPEHLFQSPVCLLRIVFSTGFSCVVGYALREYQVLFQPFASHQLLCNGVIHSAKRHDREFDFSEDLKRVYRASTTSLEIDAMEAFSISPVTLHFRSEYVERAYRWEYINNRIFRVRVFVGILVALLIAWVIYGAVREEEMGLMVIRVGAFVLMLILLYITMWNLFRRRYVMIVTIAILISILVKFLVEVIYKYDGCLITAIYPVATYGILNVDYVKISALNVINIALFAISGSVYYAMNEEPHKVDSAFIMVSYLVFLIGIALCGGILGYHLISTYRKEFRLFQQTCAEVQRCREILSCLLPEFVRSRVREGVRYIAEEKGIVTVLFCDIYDFDNIIGKMKPSEIIEFLNDLFQKFDELCTLNGVTKIETVGKTYMACAGLKDSEGDVNAQLRDICHARRAIELAFSMLRTLENYYLPDGTQIKVKIGINSGPVVAGVVGYHKPQFSLVGDTVNTASRMCSTIDTVNTIQISEAVSNFLDDRRGIKFESHFLSNVKGKGNMNTFLITETGEIDLSANSVESESNQTYSCSSLKMIFQPSSRRQSVKNEFDAYISPVTTFSCKETVQQKEIREEYLSTNAGSLKWKLLISVCVRVLILILRLAYKSHDPEITADETLIVYGVMTGLTIVPAVAVHKYLFSRWFSLCVLCRFGANCCLIFTDVYFRSDFETDLMAMEVIFALLELAHCGGVFLKEVAAGSIILVCLWSALTPFALNSSHHGTDIYLIIGFAAINVYTQYSREKRIRMYKNMTRHAKREIENTEQLLSHMMPQHVLSKLKDESDITDIIPKVTVLFADIVGFTNWSSSKSPVEVVEMLSDMFTRFDRLSVSNYVYKVHTIGDCYVVMGFAAPELSLRNFGQECLNTVKMAFDMIDVINKVNQENGSQLNMRIGLHTGTVIGGIAGTNIVRYDIYGPDVMFANKMESNGQAGKVNVSDTTRMLLEDTAPGEFHYTYNKDIEAKSLGITHKCFLVSEQGGRRSAKNPALSVPPTWNLAATTLSERESPMTSLEEIENDHIKGRQAPREFFPFMKI